MDTVLVAFWLFSSAIIAANIIVCLCHPEPSARRSYAPLSPVLSFENLASGNEETDSVGYFEKDLKTQVGGGD